MAGFVLSVLKYFLCKCAAQASPLVIYTCIVPPYELTVTG